MPEPFLGVGWWFELGGEAGGEFGLAVEPDGALRLAQYDESVRQSIWIILSTARGERVMRPDFGCGIYNFVFETNSAATAGKLVQEVRRSLLLHEPRIDVHEVQVQASRDGEVIFLSIDYQVRATNNSFNLVYPFYLERSAS